MFTQNYSGLTSKPSRLFIRAWLVFLIASMAFICMYNANNWAFHSDEIWHIHIADGESLKDVWRFAQLDTHPPLSYILLHYWLRISREPIFLRSFSLLCGLSLIPIFYLIGKRIDGKLCGLCCATLIAFSPGCINQSYQLRQYCVLLLFISLNFYFYLSWREKRWSWILVGYVLSASFAALSHFSAIFYIFTVAFFETISLLHLGNRRLLIEWVLVNLLIADIYFYIYDLWQSAILMWSSFHVYHWNLAERNELSLLAPYLAGSYIFPTLPVLIFFTIYQFKLGFSLHDRTTLRPYFILTGMALFLCMAIYFFGIYPTLGKRYSLWIVPLVLPTLGGIGAAALKKRMVLGHSFIPPLLAVAVFFFFIDIGLRFSDTDEYWEMMYGPLQAVENTLDTFGPNDLIITSRFFISTLINTYQYRTDDTFLGNTTETILPYRHTKLLLGFYNYGPYELNDVITEKDFLVTIKQALAKHLFENVNRLVFLGVADNLKSCDALSEKQIIYPKTPPGPWRVTLKKSFYFIIVSKSVFLNEVVNPHGKAHACFEGMGTHLESH